MKYLPGLPQDTMPLRSCSENRAKMLLKSILESIVTPNITRSSDSFSTVLPIVNGGDWGCIVRDRGDYHSLSLTHIQFHPQKVTPLTNSAKVTDQGLCYCNSNTWGRHNSYQSGVIGITDQLILQNLKSSEVYRRNNNWPKTLPCGTPCRHDINQFTPTRVHHNVM